MHAWQLPAFLAFVMWGLWALLPKITTSHIDPRSALFFQALGAFGVALVVLASLNFRPMLHGVAVPLAVLTALYPVLTVTLAHLFMDEPVSPRQWLGIALALLSLVLIVG